MRVGFAKGRRAPRISLGTEPSCPLRPAGRNAYIAGNPVILDDIQASPSDGGRSAEEIYPW
jgi:hypothetical protein